MSKNFECENEELKELNDGQADIIIELTEEIKILKKALYLATEQISELQFGCEEFNMCQLCSNWYTDAENCAEIECEDGFVNYFLDKAKEMLKDE